MIFKPTYQWISVRDICPAADQKVLIVRDIGEPGTIIDRLIVETAVYDNEFHCFVTESGEKFNAKYVLYWSLFPFDLEQQIYKNNE